MQSNELLQRQLLRDIAAKRSEIAMSLDEVRLQADKAKHELTCEIEEPCGLGFLRIEFAKINRLQAELATMYRIKRFWEVT